MTTDKHERYNRQIRVPQIGIEGQKKLAASTVLIVGCGALGTYASEQLARAGCGRLILVDADRIELSNLQRQSLYTTADAENQTLKVLAAAQRLALINPEVEILPLAKSFEQALFEEDSAFTAIDLVLDCTDNFLARELINELCLERQLPFVFASAAGTSGQIMPIRPTVGPCLSCVFPNLTELEQNCETAGVLTPLIPFISGLQVSLALKTLIAPETVDWESLILVNSWNLDLTKFKVHKRTSCPICQKIHSAVTFDKVCGGVYQALFPTINLDRLETYEQAKGWISRRNALALLLKKDNQEITAFKNGRVLFYQFSDSNEAKTLFKELQEVLHV